MLTFEDLVGAGLDLDPANHCFTYTYPPARIAKRDGQLGSLIADDIQQWHNYSLYLHIPFCRMTCRFCSLHRELIHGELRVSRYVAALFREIELWHEAADGVPLHALYVGGGTPTSLAPDVLAALVTKAAQGQSLSEEISVECAPDESRTLMEWITYFGELKSAGVSRISIGIESTDAATLDDMGRRGGLDAILEVVGAANGQFDSYNVDFILGYPDKTPYGGVEDAERIIHGLETLFSNGFRLPNISVYQMWDVGHVPATRRSDSVRALAIEMWRAKREVQDYLFGREYQPGPGCTYVAKPEYVHEWTRHSTLR